MNAAAALPSRTPVKLTAANFLLLRGFGAFDSFWKVELLEGELWGVPATPDGEEPDSDAEHPIKLTIDQYELLDRSGAFLGHYKTELIDGLVYPMSPQHRPHGFIKDELAYRLRRALEVLGSTLHVATEQSLAIAPFSEPQPDITLTSEPRGAGPIPGASAALVIEVSDSTAAFDRKHKAIVYATSGVPEYWLVDVNRSIVRRMWVPQRGLYQQQDAVTFGQVVESATIAELAVSTEALTQ